MHALFMLVGKKQLVDNLLLDMMHQKFQLRTHKDGEEDRFWWIDGILRELPGRIFDFIFPKESAPLVLTTLRFQHKNLTLDGNETDYAPFNVYKEFSFGPFKIKPLDMLKKFLQIEDIPEFDTSSSLVWLTKDISIIPLGVKYDTKEVTEADGFKHEFI